MSQTPIGGHPQGWEHKLADRSLPPASGEDRSKHSKHVFVQPHLPKSGGVWRDQSEGSSGSSSGRSPASPPYMRWARSLHQLLEDAEGVRLFRKFVGGAGGLHVDRLNFYFAVHGLRQETDPGKIRQVVSAIYKFLRKSQLAMPEELKQRVKVSLKDGSNIEKTVFDDMEQEVTRAITETTYQAFLRSEAYVSYVSAATQPLASPLPEQYCTELSSSSGLGLAPVPEGQEVCSTRLTHGALLATQSRRLHADIAPSRQKRSVYSAHVTYAGYCPASRQDSERASLSSGRTDSDAVSLSGSSVDGMSIRRESRESRHRARLHGLDRNAVINKEQDTAMVIPRTQRVQSEQLRVLPPDEFAPLLIEKLERLRRDQEAKERLERRLNEGEGEALPPQLVAAAIREKLQLDDDNDQDILDQHVSRVWSERTPGASPPGGRRRRYAGRRAPSATSGDSGHWSAAHPPRRSFSKKTVTELTDSGVSVVSEGANSGILFWMAESDRRAMDGDRRRELRGDSLERDRRAVDGDRRPLADGDRRRELRADSLERDRREKQQRSRSKPATSDPPHTVVVVTFLDENLPYRFKVPAAPLTLKIFKEYLPRKGNYRYFFKTNCLDLDTVIQEEVSSDNDTLPMFEGKVMARVKSIE